MSLNDKATNSSLWQRWLRRLRAIDDATTMTYDDIQDRRLDRIERELGELRQALSVPDGSEHPSRIR